MAPSATLPVDSHPVPSKDDKVFKSRNTGPLKKSGALEAAFKFEDLTPPIGREITGQIVEDIFNAPNADELIRDLAITISERGVVFFRNQSSMTDELQKQLILRLGEQSGRPSTSTIHRYPIARFLGPDAKDRDFEIATMSSKERADKVKVAGHPSLRKNSRIPDANWHSDIQFEVCPADYISLRLEQLPENGGDTLFASGYDIYERFSKPYQKLFEGLTVSCRSDGLHKLAEAGKIEIYDQPRGSPANAGTHLSAVHPVVRTNPVTGWKSLFGMGPYITYYNEITPEEGTELNKRFYQTILDNHDIQARFKWRNKNDIAIWDNRCVFHSATFDYDGLGDRVGKRIVGIGEKPYYDSNSLSKSEALAASVGA